MVCAKNSGMSSADRKRPPIGPGSWPGWAAVALLWLLGRMPPRLGRWLVKPLGPLMYAGLRRRRRIARRNIEKCFPDLDPREQTALVRASFASLARMLVEMAWCWSAPPERVAAMIRVEGMENLQDAEEAGRGVLVLTFHSTCMEMGGFMLGHIAHASGVYRPLKNPVLEWYQNRGRGRYAAAMIPKSDARRIIRALQNGGVLWYAPDQDFGPDKTEFAAFFGIQTATLLAIHRLPALTGCAVLPMFMRFDQPSGGYVLTLSPALEHFPGDDAVTDLARVNAVLESQVRQVPEQYWWMHRRFKTRPAGEEPFYD
jgi:KDO2-lipid IV(A) lauroyltransferase